MYKDKKESQNIVLVIAILGAFLLFMLGSVVYKRSQIANYSRVLKRLTKSVHYNF